jgi:hypothetical protein
MRAGLKGAVFVMVGNRVVYRCYIDFLRFYGARTASAQSSLVIWGRHSILRLCRRAWSLWMDALVRYASFRQDAGYYELIVTLSMCDIDSKLRSVHMPKYCCIPCDSASRLEVL